jgi:hypothetical protein
MMAFARMAYAVISLFLLLPAGAARAAAVDPDTPDYLRPLDARAAIETERGADGRLVVRVNGEQFDGRRLVASLLDEAWRGDAAGGADFDLHMQIAALGGFNGETLNGVDLALSRRGGRMSQFSLTARAGADARVRGGIRTLRDGRPFIYLETDNAGALLRFADILAHVAGGRGWMAIALEATSAASRDGTLHLSDFGLLPEGLPQAIREIVVLPSPLPGPRLVNFSHLDANYTLTPGKLTIADSMLRSPTLGMTLDGLVEGERLNLRGYLLPLAAMEMERENCTTNRGCFYAMPYRVQGTRHAPQIQINTYLNMTRRHLFDEP